MQVLMIPTHSQRNSAKLIRQASPHSNCMKNITSSSQQQQQAHQQQAILMPLSKNKIPLMSKLSVLGHNINGNTHVNDNTRFIPNSTNTFCPFPKSNFGVGSSCRLGSGLEPMPSLNSSPNNEATINNCYIKDNMNSNYRNNIDNFDDGCENNNENNLLNIRGNCEYKCNHLRKSNDPKNFLPYTMMIGSSKSQELPLISASAPGNSQFDAHVYTLKIISNWALSSENINNNNRNNDKMNIINDLIDNENNEIYIEDDKSSFIEISSINILDKRESPLDIFLVTTVPKIEDQNSLKEITNSNLSEKYDADTKRGDIALCLNTKISLKSKEFTFFLMVQSNPEPHFLQIANGFSEMAIKAFEISEGGKTLYHGSLEPNETRQICILPYELHISKSLDLGKSMKPSFNDTWNTSNQQVKELGKESLSPLTFPIGGNNNANNESISQLTTVDQKTKFLEIVIDDTFCEGNNFIGLNAIDMYDINNLLIDNIKIENIFVQGCKIITNKYLLLKRSKEVDEWENMFLAEKISKGDESVKIRFEFKEPVFVARVIFWNFNASCEKPIEFGAKNCQIKTSLKEACVWKGVLNMGTGSKDSVAQTRTDIWLIERKLFF